MARIRRRAFPKDGAKQGKEYGMRGQLQKKPDEEKRKDRKK